MLHHISVGINYLKLHLLYFYRSDIVLVSHHLIVFCAFWTILFYSRQTS